MKVGTLGFATDQGLGVLIKSFYDNRVVDDVVVIRHGRRVTHTEWYPNSLVTGVISCAEVLEFCRSVDVMLFFETPFDWSLISSCREMGVKTVLMPMHECMPKTLPQQPDLILAPSLLDQVCYPGCAYLPIPVDVSYKRRTHARTFVHNAGNLGLRGRNGTLELMQAMEYVVNPIELLIRSQTNEIHGLIRQTGIKQDRRVSIQVGTVPHNLLWDYGDVFVFPEKFNGLSLPIQESCAAGMLVMATDRFPNNQYLPTEPLIPTQGFNTVAIAGHLRTFEEAVIKPKDLAAHIDKWYETDISPYSDYGLTYAKENTWEELGPRYRKLLEDLVNADTVRS